MKEASNQSEIQVIIRGVKLRPSPAGSGKLRNGERVVTAT